MCIRDRISTGIDIAIFFLQFLYKTSVMLGLLLRPTSYITAFLVKSDVPAKQQIGSCLQAKTKLKHHK